MIRAARWTRHRPLTERALRTPKAATSANPPPCRCTHPHCTTPPYEGMPFTPPS
jgi:hypothetical protein